MENKREIITGAAVLTSAVGALVSIGAIVGAVIGVALSALAIIFVL